MSPIADTDNDTKANSTKSFHDLTFNGIPTDMENFFKSILSRCNNGHSSHNRTRYRHFHHPYNRGMFRTPGTSGRYQGLALLYEFQAGLGHRRETGATESYETEDLGC